MFFLFAFVFCCSTGFSFFCTKRESCFYLPKFLLFVLVHSNFCVFKIRTFENMFSFAKKKFTKIMTCKFIRIYVCISGFFSSQPENHVKAVCSQPFRCHRSVKTEVVVWLLALPSTAKRTSGQCCIGPRTPSRRVVCLWKPDTGKAPVRSEVPLVLWILLQSSDSCALCQRVVGSGFPFCRFHRYRMGADKCTVDIRTWKWAQLLSLN